MAQGASCLGDEGRQELLAEDVDKWENSTPAPDHPQMVCSF